MCTGRPTSTARHLAWQTIALGQSPLTSTAATRWSIPTVTGLSPANVTTSRDRASRCRRWSSRRAAGTRARAEARAHAGPRGVSTGHSTSDQRDGPPAVAGTSRRKMVCLLAIAAVVSLRPGMRSSMSPKRMRREAMASCICSAVAGFPMSSRASRATVDGANRALVG